MKTSVDPKQDATTPAWADYQLVQGSTAQPIAITDKGVLRAVYDHLVNDGWQVAQETGANPFDLEATKAGKRLLVEAKVPSAGLDFDSVLGQMAAYATDPAAQYVIAVPSRTLNLLKKPAAAPQGLDVSLYEVSDSGKIVAKDKISSA